MTKDIPTGRTPRSRPGPQPQPGNGAQRAGIAVGVAGFWKVSLRARATQFGHRRERTGRPGKVPGALKFQKKTRRGLIPGDCPHSGKRMPAQMLQHASHGVCNSKLRCPNSPAERSGRYASKARNQGSRRHPHKEVGGANPCRCGLHQACVRGDCLLPSTPSLHALSFSSRPRRTSSFPTSSKTPAFSSRPSPPRKSSGRRCQTNTSRLCRRRGPSCSG